LSFLQRGGRDTDGLYSCYPAERSKESNGDFFEVLGTRGEVIAVKSGGDGVKEERC